MGKDIPGCEVVKNYDLGAGLVHVAWIFKPELTPGSSEERSLRETGRTFKAERNKRRKIVENILEFGNNLS
jgi:hypothetical protein